MTEYIHNFTNEAEYRVIEIRPMAYEILVLFLLQNRHAFVIVIIIIVYYDM